MDEVIDLYENPNDSYEEDNDGEEKENRPEGEEGEEGAENPENPEKVNVDPAKPKRVVRKMFKLNLALLKGPRGITALPKYFENVKLKGKGYEKQDLDVILKNMEHWAHRMYPKFNFEDSLDTIEKIGKKREIHTFMTKYRMDMLEPVISEVIDEPDNEEMMGPIDEFDELLDQQIASSTIPSSTMGRNKTFAGNSQLNISGISGISSQKDPEEPVRPPSPPITLNEEMRRKIAENRLKALERLKAKKNPPPVPASQDPVLASQDSVQAAVSQAPVPVSQDPVSISQDLIQDF